MLVEKVEVILVKRIQFPFKYKRISGERKIYVRDYDTTKPFHITKGQLKPLEYNSNVTVILKYQRKYYWCPQFDEVYKDFTSGLNVNKSRYHTTLKRSLDMTMRTTYPTLSFTYRHAKFESNDVKQLIILGDADN